MQTADSSMETSGTPRFGARSRSACCSSLLFPPTRRRGTRGTSGLNGIWLPSGLAASPAACRLSYRSWSTTPMSRTHWCPTASARCSGSRRPAGKRRRRPARSSPSFGHSAPARRSRLPQGPLPRNFPRTRPRKRPGPQNTCTLSPLLSWLQQLRAGGG